MSTRGPEAQAALSLEEKKLLARQKLEEARERMARVKELQERKAQLQEQKTTVIHSSGKKIGNNGF